MTSSVAIRRVALAAGAAGLMLMGVLSACGTADKPAETVPGQQAPAGVPAPTEKKAGAPVTNSFSPTVTARPAPTALPGNVITGG